MTRPNLPNGMTSTGVVAVLRAPSPEAYLPVCRTLVDAGVIALELTLTTPGTIEFLPRLRAELPTAVIGVGTVTNADQTHAAINAGADFLVTPVTRSELIEIAVAAGVPIVSGGLTPTEVFEGWSLGASAIKIFPAAAVGTGYLSQLAGPFPNLATVPSGGVELDDIPAWIKAGAIAVSLGGPLLGDAFRGGELGDLRDRAMRAIDAVQTARQAAK